MIGAVNIVAPENDGGAVDDALYAPVSLDRIAAAKRAFTTRRADLAKACLLQTGGASPAIGDIVLARVIKPSQHGRIELLSGRRAALYPGDEIIVAFGGRYATDQFEGLPPTSLEPCHLVAGGGVAAVAVHKHGKMRGATEIVPVGLLCDAGGKALNLRDFAVAADAIPADRPPIVMVLGTAMNAGKTTAVANLVRGAVEAGERVGVAKATGTGSGGDLWSALDAGAAIAVDFTDAGYPSTYKIGAPAIEHSLTVLIAELTRAGVDRIIIEIADGLLFEETATLVQSPLFRSAADAIVLAAGDAMGAIASEHMLQRFGHQAAALTGLFTAAPLAIREVAAVASTPVVATSDLRSFDPLSGSVLHLLDAAALTDISTVDVPKAANAAE